MKNCVFCKIANHQAPANIVIEDNDIMAFMDIDPISDGHVLIIPKKDIKDLHTLSYDLGAKIMNAARKVADVLKNEFQYDSVSLMETNGAFQDVPHFHLHIYGRNIGNDIKFEYPKGVKKDLEHIAKIADKIKEQLL